MAFFARNCSLVLLFAGVAQANITGRVLQYTTNEVVLAGVVDTDNVTAGSVVVTVEESKFTATATSTATVEIERHTGGSYEKETVTDAVIAVAAGANVTVTFTSALVIAAGDTFLMTLPLTYQATGAVFNLNMQGTGNDNEDLTAFDSTKVCTCGSGGASGFNLSATMTCANDVADTTDITLLIVHDAELKAFDAADLNLTTSAKTSTKTINGETAVVGATPFVNSATEPYATVTMKPKSGTTIAAGDAITMAVVPDSSFTDSTDDFEITCSARAFCIAGVDIASVGQVAFCSSSASRMAGASILAVLMAGVSMLV